MSAVATHSQKRMPNFLQLDSMIAPRCCPVPQLPTFRTAVSGNLRCKKHNKQLRRHTCQPIGPRGLNMSEVQLPVDVGTRFRVVSEASEDVLYAVRVEKYQCDTTFPNLCQRCGETDLQRRRCVSIGPTATARARSIADLAAPPARCRPVGPRHGSCQLCACRDEPEARDCSR